MHPLMVSLVYPEALKGDHERPALRQAQGERVGCTHFNADTQLAITVSTFTEIYEGIYDGRDPQAAELTFRTFLQGVTVLGINRTVAKRHAQIRGQLRQQKRPIRALDLLIAATALTYSLMLVARNIRNYNDIPDLKLYPLS